MISVIAAQPVLPKSLAISALCGMEKDGGAELAMKFHVPQPFQKASVQRPTFWRPFAPCFDSTDSGQAGIPSGQWYVCVVLALLQEREVSVSFEPGACCEGCGGPSCLNSISCAKDQARSTRIE